MEAKKSFILHYDSLSVIDKMSDEQVGKLLRKMRSYHNWNNYDPNDLVVDVAFEQFKNQFDRDLGKYKNVCIRNAENGKKGGRPPKENNPKNPSGFSENPTEPKKADNDNDNDNDNKKETKKDILFSDFWKLYPNKKGKNISETRYKKNITEQLHKEIIQGVKGYIRDTEQLKAKGLFAPAYKQGSTFLNQKARKDYEVTKQEAFTEAYNQSDATIYSGRCKDNIGESRSLDPEYVKPYNDLKTAINMKGAEWGGYNDFISKYL